MSSAETSRVCCICKKLFCCAQCRSRHEKNKHPNRRPNCPLCSCEKLPLQLIEDKTLFCHIVITHLPLYCTLCGETFRQSKDLETFGKCKWWQSRHRHSLISGRKSLLGTPPLESNGKEQEQSLINGEYNGNFCSLTSPPELHRNTSTPMIVGQKTSFDFKTPKVPNFSLKTPQTNSLASTNSQSHVSFHASTNEHSKSTYVSFTPSANQEDTPFRSLSSNRNEKKDNHLPRTNSGRKLDIMKEQDENPEKLEYITDNNCVEDMELTDVEGEMLPDSQSLEMLGEKSEKRSESKKVRFSDQFDIQPDSPTTGTFNMTENEEFFEARESMSEIKEPLEDSQVKIYQENQKNSAKENKSPKGNKIFVNQQSGSSRVVMMVVVENNSAMTTTDLIDTGLKKLEHVVSSSYPSAPERSSPGSSNSIASVDSYYSVSNYESYTATTSMSSGRAEPKPVENNPGPSSGGILSVVAQAVRSVMKNFSGPLKAVTSEPIPQQENVAPLAGASAVSNLLSTLERRPGKRTREIVSPPAPPRPVNSVIPVEPRSPLAKRYRRWDKIKGRPPISRMRNAVTSPRGVSSETQVFSQGSLIVGDTVLPLPARAHQSTQTE